MITLENCSKIYNRGKENQIIAINDVSLSIEEGQLVAFVGKSGAGKSTLLHVLAGLGCCENGKYMLDNVDVFSLKSNELISFRRNKIGIVLQNFALLEDYSVYENVSLPLRFTSKTMGEYNRKKQIIDHVLKKVGISNLYKRKVGSLSGGQKQRVAIARALVNEPRILLADEPTGALDSKTTEEIMKLFLELNEAGMTILIVTHDKKVSSMCSRIIELNDGRIISDLIKF